MKHIFTSQNNLNNARCRSIRQLEAKLDKQAKNESNSLSKMLSGATKQGGIKSQDDTRQHFFERSASLPVETQPAHTLGDNSVLTQLNSFTPQEDYKINSCEYNDICPLHKYSMKCIFGQNRCRTYHFYKKYKKFDNGRQYDTR